MNKTLTSQEAILQAGKQLIMESGMQGLNMRQVAQKCGVAIGSVYNYFPSKTDLIVATIESVWAEIMHDSRHCMLQIGFEETVLSLFEAIHTGCTKYPSFFTVHSVSVTSMDKSKGREVMNDYFLHMKKGLLIALSKDEKVKNSAFDETFTAESFVDFVFSNLLNLWMQHAQDCKVLLEIIRRTIY